MNPPVVTMTQVVPHVRHYSHTVPNVAASVLTFAILCAMFLTAYLKHKWEEVTK